VTASQDAANVVDSGLSSMDDSDSNSKKGKKASKKEKRKGRKKKRSKSRSRFTKQKQRSYVKGNIIGKKHELYTTSIAMMVGLRHAIGGIATVASSDSTIETSISEIRSMTLGKEDFASSKEIAFPPRGSDSTLSHNLSHTFRFKTYAPNCFSNLRQIFGIQTPSFLTSICGNSNFIEFVSNAQSGQFFFYSHDGKYMIKTMTGSEANFLQSILPDYFSHCAKNPNTLITKFVGMYKVKMYHLRRNVKFIIMKSVFDTDVFIREVRLDEERSDEITTLH